MVFFRKNKFEGLEFPKDILINDINYEIEVIFSPKKSSSAVIRDNKMIFRLSSRLSRKQADEHFNHLLKKLSIKASRNDNSNNVLTIEKVIENGEFVFANVEYRLELAKTRGVKFRDDVFYINYRTRPELVEKHIIKILISIYSDRIESYVRQINDSTFKFKYGDIELKDLKSKWGHCTATNNLMFNLKLLNASIEILDYVIIHELAHIKVKNHSDRFWREVARFCPNHKALRKELNNSPPKVFQEK